MEGQTIDPVEFRGAQKKSWDSAATGWEKWSDTFDQALDPTGARLVELAGVQAGSRVLDVAAGYGEPALTAAKVAGADGSVVATDISADMLAYGRQRAADAGIDNVEFVESGAMDLDFPADSFDAAVSRFGIIFEPDGEGAAAKVRGFLEDGARFAIASWGQPEEVPFLSIPMQTVMKRLDVPPPPPGTPGPLSRPTHEALGGLLEGGGFSDVKVEDAEATFEWESPEEFTTFTQETIPPIRAMLEPHPEDVQKATWDAVTEAVREKVGGDGPVKFTNRVLLASGTA
jgi:ubiquinone/menaquinone biosynthesis C-methylase UbiE